ncbi:uncharacterized protein BDZ99DRAFT_462762 [Mytilinidion resinicola]|uniref:SWIM-type domain-containing protein n=1 Tax=Mytilinidion resinicola TaxID=574789 RepID=A0A6A6YQ73_9PEZI|nr:uncharacterized protein BDZ99DRAFT_462762 [Mytilinidion resinicola]KAF2810164.1 hypothetical protein BDZ99DRAFT_462762 [Mytilinidion resinicola]
MSGIRYDVSALEEEVRQRVEAALGDDHHIRINYCVEREGDENEPDGYYAFRISDQISIRVGTDHPGYQVPKCSCGGNVGGIACKHIFWLEDQLANEDPETFRSGLIPLTADGSKIKNQPPSKVIDDIGLEEIAERKDWVLQDDAEDPEEEMTEMLSVFEPSRALANEMKEVSGQGSPASHKSISPHSRIYKEFTNLITEYATEDIGMLYRIREIITPGFQAEVFFEKMSDRATESFREIDETLTRGATAIDSCDIPTIAERLKRLVKGIEEGYSERVSGSESPSKQAAIKAAAALIDILEGVVDRNQDMAWTRLGNDDEPIQARNIFAYLIGAPLDSSSHFVLDVLKDLPQDVVVEYQKSRLDSIRAKLIASNAPPAYMNLFRKIISQESKKRSNPEVGGSSAKKPMK